MKKIIFFIILTSGASVIQSCRHDAAYPEVCFTSQVLPIYVSKCAMTGCHDGTSAEQNIILTDYAHIMEGVHAYHPGQSRYYTVLTGSGEESMPPSNPLSESQISLIKAWIEQGAQETDCSSSSCDTTNVTFSGTIQSILSNNCTGCHNSGNASGGVNIDGYANLKSYLDANKTNFLNSISYTSAIKMPPSYQLSDCNIKQIDHWVAAGYQNN